MSLVNLQIIMYRTDVVSLPDGVFAHVILVWEEVCWSNYTNNHFFEKGAVRSPLS